jgi:thiosulfate reductase cytochrome b subunit
MDRIYLHPLPVRIWHWANAVTCVLLFLTGIQIRYVGSVDVMPFRIAVGIHNWAGFVLIANFFLWLGFYLSSNRIKVYHTELNPKKFFLACFRQMMYYSYGIIRQDPEPFHPTPLNKFNALQAMTYQILMFLVISVQAFTGILLWDLTRFSGTVTLLGGVRVIDTVHVLIFIFFAAFIPAHAYLGMLGRTSLQHYKEMVTGYAEKERENADATK